MQNPFQQNAKTHPTWQETALLLGAIGIAFLSLVIALHHLIFGAVS